MNGEARGTWHRLASGRCYDARMRSRSSIWYLAFCLLVGCKDVRQKCAGGDLEACKTSCDQGEAMSCSHAGAMYLLGSHGVPQDDAKLADYKNRACTLGDLSSCNELGLFYKNGFHASKDFAKARALLKKACDGSEPNSCDSLKDVPK
jgi:TPR repeat protein